MPHFKCPVQRFTASSSHRHYFGAKHAVFQQLRFSEKEVYNIQNRFRHESTRQQGVGRDDLAGDHENQCRARTLRTSLPQETEIHHLPPEAVDEGVVYEVVNELGDKVGELAGSQLAFLVRRAVELDLNELLNAIEDGVVVLDREGRIAMKMRRTAASLEYPCARPSGGICMSLSRMLCCFGCWRAESLTPESGTASNRWGNMYLCACFRVAERCGGRTFSIFRDVTELNRLGMEVERITQVAEELTSQLDVELSRFQMIGQDPQFRTLLSRAVTAAKTDATVLIRGENGVGKEGFAKLIHQASPRRNRPFITVNCAAIPEALIESELFGYEEGSFTGARKGGKLGKFELAQGGTLFLDEVGDMPLICRASCCGCFKGGRLRKSGGKKTWRWMCELWRPPISPWRN